MNASGGAEDIDSAVELANSVSVGILDAIELSMRNGFDVDGRRFTPALWSVTTHTVCDVRGSVAV